MIVMCGCVGVWVCAGVPPGGRGGRDARPRAVRHGVAGAVPVGVAAARAAAAAGPLAAAHPAQRAQAAHAALSAGALRRRRAAALPELRTVQYDIFLSNPTNTPHSS